MRVGIDIDGVIYNFCDAVADWIERSREGFTGTIREHLEREGMMPLDRSFRQWEFYQDWGLSTEDFVRICDEGVDAGFIFTHGEPMFGTQAALAAIRSAGHQIVFVTARTFGSPGWAAVSTHRWMETYRLFDVGDEIHFSVDKTGFDLDVILDDHVDVLESFDGPTLEGQRTLRVMFEQPYNVDRGVGGVDSCCSWQVTSLGQFVTEVIGYFDDGYVLRDVTDLFDCFLDLTSWNDQRERNEENRRRALSEMDAMPIDPELERLLAEEAEIEAGTRALHEPSFEPVEIGDYATKDSGVRQEFGSGARRDTQAGKPRYDLIPPGPLKRHAELMARGAEKYDDHNWTLGMPTSRFMASAMRHLEQYRAGDREEDHLAAVAFNVYAIMFFEGTEHDDMAELPWAPKSDDVVSEAMARTSWSLVFDAPPGHGPRFWFDRFVSVL